MMGIQTQLYDILKYWFFDLAFFLLLFVILAFFLVFLLRHIGRKKTCLYGEIHDGLRNNEFHVFYQPVHDAVTGKCTGAEALLRWQRCDGKLISPNVFIATAEREGLIIRLTHYLFEKISEDTSDWAVAEGFYLGINISPSHLESSGFVNDILGLSETLMEKKIKILLEITERDVIKNNAQAKRILSYLREKGISVAIDDFGTGYCSLSCLETLPLDHLKIDKSFVDTINKSENRTPVLDMIIKLAKELNLKVTAEGVEAEYQGRYLKESGVDFMQGYLYSRPMNSAVFIQWYEDR